jgi:hypothetical protein
MAGAADAVQFEKWAPVLERRALSIARRAAFAPEITRFA